MFGCTQKRDLTQNTLIVHILSEPRGLHITNDNNAYQRMIFQCTQKRLISIDLKTNSLIPDLLVEIPVLLPDSLSYKCRLRKGVKWDDGSEFSVEDVIFTMKVITCPLINNPDTKPYFKKLQGIEIDPNDKYSFLVKTSKRYFDNPSMLSFALMMQKKQCDPDGLLDEFTIDQFHSASFQPDNYPQLKSFAENFNAPSNGRIPAKMNGLGPYKVSDWQTGSSITLLRKENWWGKNSESPYEKAYPEKIIFEIIKDMESVVLSLKKQQVDVSCELSTAALIKLQKRKYFNEHYDSEFVGAFNYTYMGMNMRPEGERAPFFTDKRVRKAMAHLVPVEEIIEVIAKGRARRMASFIQPDQKELNTSLKVVPYNLSLARKLLDEAGWKDSDGDNILDKLINGKRISFSFSLSYPISPVTKEIALMIKNECYKAGIEVKPNALDFSLFYQNANNHAFDAMLGSWSSNALPEDPRQLWHTESWITKGSNFVGFGSAYTDSLIEAADVEMNPYKRAIIMGELQQIVWEDQPYVFLYNATRKVAIHRRFENRGIYPERPHVLFNNLKLSAEYSQKTPANF